MKRIWFGAVLLVVLLILSIGSSTFMERTHLPLAEDLSRAAALAMEENWPAAQELASGVRRSWEKKQPIVAALADHQPMDHIEGLFAQLNIFADSQDAASFASTCMYLARQLEALGKSHKLDLQNLF